MGDVPAPAALGLTTLKHQIRDLLLQSLTSGADLPPAALRKALELQLSAAGVRLIGADWERRSHPYGNVIDISVEVPSEMAAGLAVTTTLAIPCGQDSSLYILGRQEGRWHLLMAEESDGYSRISGAQGGCTMQFLPRTLRVDGLWW
jgi:hypothetical protein